MITTQNALILSLQNEVSALKLEFVKFKLNPSLDPMPKESMVENCRSSFFDSRNLTKTVDKFNKSITRDNVFKVFTDRSTPSTYVNMRRGSDNRPLPKSFAETEIKEVLDHIEDSSSEDDDESGIDREVIIANKAFFYIPA